MVAERFFRTLNELIQVQVTTIHVHHCLQTHVEFVKRANENGFWRALLLVFIEQTKPFRCKVIHGCTLILNLCRSVVLRREVTNNHFG